MIIIIILLFNLHYLLVLKPIWSLLRCWQSAKCISIVHCWSTIV